MSSGFGRNYPALVKVRPNSVHERERLFFFASAGLAAFLFFTIIFVLNFKDSADAKQEIAPLAANPVPASISTIILLAPEKAIKAGTKLSEIGFKEVYWPRNQVPQEAIRDRAELRDFFAAVDIAEGAPLQRQHLTREPMGVTLPLTPGNRAVSIEVDATSGIEGFALPGTRVDVVLTYMDVGNLTSKIIVQNARVLSYGGDATTANRMQNRVREIRETKKTLTLDVSPQDALQIQTARELGRLSLLMRSADDYKSPSVIEFNKNDIESSAPEAPSKPKCKTGSMRIEGREFMIDCDGSIQQIDAFEP